MCDCVTALFPTHTLVTLLVELKNLFLVSSYTWRAHFFCYVLLYNIYICSSIFKKALISNFPYLQTFCVVCTFPIAHYYAIITIRDASSEGYSSFVCSSWTPKFTVFMKWQTVYGDLSCTFKARVATGDTTTSCMFPLEIPGSVKGITG